MAHVSSSPARAQIHTLGGFSVHTDQSELLDWLAPMAPAQPHIVFTHGEEHDRGVLARHVAERFGIAAELPLLNDVITIGGADL